MTETKIYHIGIQSRNEIVSHAAKTILDGGLVVFPTETVYGLGADALNPRAVKRIFEVKGRPTDNPLIVHVSSINMAATIGKDIPHLFYDLAERFWPGPLTMIVKKANIVPDITTAGLPKVAIRMPAKDIVLDIISTAGRPIAAPSANLSGKPSPTTVEHVIDDLSGKVDIIIDGGQCDIGLESTVIDVTCNVPRIYRPGGLPLEEIEGIVGTLEYIPYSDGKVLSPGQKYRHYAPQARLIVYYGPGYNDVIVREIKKHLVLGRKVGILCVEEHRDIYNKAGASEIICLGNKADARSISKNLFAALREMDKRGVDVILSEGFEERGLGLAIMDRLMKASEQVITHNTMVENNEGSH